MKMSVSWDVAQCSLIELKRRFGYAYCFYHRRSVMSEVLVSFYETTCHDAHKSHLKVAASFVTFQAKVLRTRRKKIEIKVVK
jgi:hypothetical protein